MNSSANPTVLLSDNSEMSELIHRFDWSKTPIGQMSEWPGELIHTVNLILRSSAPFVILWGQDATMIYNDAYRAIAGPRHPGCLGSNIYKVCPESAEFMKDVIQKCLDGQQVSFKNSHHVINRNTIAEHVWMDLDFSPIIDGNGTPAGLLGLTIEVTQQVKSQHALRNSEERLRMAMQAAQKGIWDWDFKSDTAWWNDRYTEIIGIDIPEAERSLAAVNKYIHPDDARKVPEALKAYLENKEKFEVEYRIIRPTTGEIRTIAGKGKALFDENGEVTRMTGIITDITDRKLIEETLQKSEYQFRQIANSLPLVIWTAAPDGGLTYISDQWEQIYGNPVKESLGTSWAAFVHPDDVVQAGNMWAHSISTGSTYETEFRVHHKDGTYHWILVRAVPIRGEEGQIISWYGSNTDIQEKKTSEEAVMESEERFRTLADNISQLAWMTDADGYIFWYNKRWFDYTGTVMQQMEGWGWQQVHHPDHIDRVTAKFRRHLGLGTAWEDTFPLMGKDGQYRWFLSRAIPIKNNNGDVTRWFGTNTDITEQKEAEEALRQSSYKFEKLLEAVPQMTWTNLPNGKINFYNQQWYNYTGLNFEETKGWGWKSVIHPDDLNKTLKDFLAALENGSIFVTENRYRRRDGTYRWHLNRALPIKNEQGEITLFVGTATDIQEQKETEAHLEKLVGDRTLQLERSNNDLQQFAHVASHDLKEPLRKIRIFSGMLEEDFKEVLPDGAKNFLDKIQNASSRMQMMIDGVLAYSSINGSEQSIEDIDLNSIINNVESDLEVMIKQKNALLHFHNLPTIQGAKVLINQLFYNLIFNALKFSKPGVAPEIAISAQSTSRFYTITIQDNGIGFDEEYSTKIFDTFVRLHSKDNYEGTGLGLSLCKKIVQRHNGTIEAHSIKGLGATFTITLPVTQKKLLI